LTQILGQPCEFQVAALEAAKACKECELPSVAGNYGFCLGCRPEAGRVPQLAKLKLEKAEKKAKKQVEKTEKAKAAQAAVQAALLQRPLNPIAIAAAAVEGAAAMRGAAAEAHAQRQGRDQGSSGAAASGATSTAPKAGLSALAHAGTGTGTGLAEERALQSKCKMTRKCQDCQVEPPSFGLPSDHGNRRKRWCEGCSKAHAGAVAVKKAAEAPKTWGPTPNKILVANFPEVQPRVISDCHFSVPLNHFIPGFLSYSVPVFLK
jgi:hypothetical protein